MNIKLFIKVLIFVILIVMSISIISCKEELVGTVDQLIPPQTELLNIPVPNTIENLYSPIIKVGWRGISEGALIKGFWVSWKSYYLVKKDSVKQDPYFTTEVTQEIAFSSADSINKQILLVKSEDEYGNIDPVGAALTLYTSRTKPPQTQFIFPDDSSSAFFLNNTTNLWLGVRIDCKGTTETGVLKDYSIKVDGGNWSEWQPSPVFYLNKEKYHDLTEGMHSIKAISRNNVLVEDPTPAEITITLVKPSHDKEWLIIDDTKDQSGSTERPSDEQVDLFYDALLIGVPHDSYDIIKEGMIQKDLIGQYKYVLWHSDDYHQTDLPEAIGVLTDYLNTGGRILISGWNFYSYFDPDGSWVDDIPFYGNFLTDYLHLNGQRTIGDASLDGVMVVGEEDSVRNLAELDTDKIYSFRKGLYKVNNYNNLGSFTNPLFYYHSADTVNTRSNNVVGYGYHNSVYRVVVSGFPFYYLTEQGAAKVFNRSKQYFEENFPY